MDRRQSRDLRKMSMKEDLLPVALDKVKSEVLGPEAEGKYINTFLLDQINHLGLEQERFVIVAKDAMHRVTWSFSKQKATSQATIHYSDIKQVIKGTLELKKMMKVPGTELDNITGRTAVRIFTSLKEPSAMQRFS